MIVKMSKIAVFGPRDLLVQVLATIRQSATLQIDMDIQKRIEEGPESRLRPLLLDARALGKRLFYEDLDRRVDRLLTLLPDVPSRESYLSAPHAITSIATVLDKRLDLCETRMHRREALERELNELSRYLMFLTTVDSLVPKGAEAAGLDVIAVDVRDPAALERLTRVAGRLLLGADVRTAKAEDGSYIGLLTAEKSLAEQLKEALREDQIPEVSLPAYLQGLSLAEKIKTVRARAEALTAEADTIDREQHQFAQTWRGLYAAVHAWLQGQLSLLKTSALAYGTDNCFVLFGWIPSTKLAVLRNALATQHGDTVVVEEKEILVQDLAQVPVTLSNPRYFRPFELLISLLPLPRYTSFDPTPFIGIFFPVFFGMILGDAGYGVLLLLIALGLVFFAKHRQMLHEAGLILAISSVYTILFGLLYGECFGDVGYAALGLNTACVDRRTSLIPMLYFALAMGIVHVGVGLFLGFLSALKGKQTKEAAFRLASVFAVLCIVGILASYYAPVAALVRRPLMIAGLIVAPVLLITGGLLAPFELVRHLGNIVSYARIMAVGLASVLLAHVANNLAGALGSVWVGIVVAVLLHAFNIVLGVFAPTIHVLRLHYVEFFGKFLEPGGRPYEPLKQGQ